MTRFGKISSLLYNVKKLAILKVLFGKILSLLWQILYAIGRIFIALICQILKNNPPSGHTGYRCTLTVVRFEVVSPNAAV